MPKQFEEILRRATSGEKLGDIKVSYTYQDLVVTFTSNQETFRFWNFLSKGIRKNPEDFRSIPVGFFLITGTTGEVAGEDCAIRQIPPPSGTSRGTGVSWTEMANPDFVESRSFAAILNGSRILSDRLESDVTLLLKAALGIDGQWVGVTGYNMP